MIDETTGTIRAEILSMSAVSISSQASDGTATTSQALSTRIIAVSSSHFGTPRRDRQPRGSFTTIHWIDLRKFVTHPTALFPERTRFFSCSGSMIDSRYTGKQIILH